MSSIFSKKIKNFKKTQNPLKQRHKTILIKNKNGLKSIVRRVLFFEIKPLQFVTKNDI